MNLNWDQQFFYESLMEQIEEQNFMSSYHIIEFESERTIALAKGLWVREFLKRDAIGAIENSANYTSTITLEEIGDICDLTSDIMIFKLDELTVTSSKVYECGQLKFKII